MWYSEYVNMWYVNIWYSEYVVLMWFEFVVLSDGGNYNSQVTLHPTQKIWAGFCKVGILTFSCHVFLK